MGHDRLRLLVTVALAGLAGAWLSYVHLYVPSGGRPLQWRAHAFGRLQLPRATTEIFRTRSEFERFINGLNVGVVPPRIDFEREVAVLIALGPRSSTGSTLDLTRVEEQRGRVLVVVRELYTPGARPLVTYSLLIVVLRETGKPIAVDWR